MARKDCCGALRSQPCAISCPRMRRDECSECHTRVDFACNTGVTPACLGWFCACAMVQHMQHVHVRDLPHMGTFISRATSDRISKDGP